MKGRGQESFVRLPGFAAKLYNTLTQTEGIERTHQEIARDLTSRLEHGRVLDVGTGPGKLLREIHQLNPGIELFGLDISAAMVQLAKKNLADIDVDVRCGDIRRTNYQALFFDIVTCTGSFYMWDHPNECLEEIFRITKPSGSAYLYETHRDLNTHELQRALKTNLSGESLVRRLVTPFFLRKQLRMTYRTEEFAEIIKRTSFATSYTIGEVTLGGLPAFLRIQLNHSCAAGIE